MDKDKKKIYIRTFYFSDNTKESVESENGADMMGPTYRGAWAREKFNKAKILEIKDTIRFE